jgi:hypothetical protein
MRIPAWVDGARSSKSKRASSRLRFICNHLAAQYTERASLRALGELVGLDHSTIAIYIRRGAFSLPAAEKIVAALPAKAIRASDLTNPLEIKA